MNPELNHEYPKPGEAKLIEEIVKVAVERMKTQQGRIRRGQHAKAIGCVRGLFIIRDDVADDLRHGVFHQPGQSFQAIVRFSNSSETIDPDGKGTARGMAIKLLDVDGTPAIPGTDNRCQDFLTVNHPVFPFATPAEYVKFFDLRETPLVGDPLAVAWLALFHHRHL
jgi:catalase